LDLDFGEATEFEQVELMLDVLPVQEWIENGPQFEQQKFYSDFDNENIPSSIALYVEAIYEGENLVQYPNLPNNEENEDEVRKEKGELRGIIILVPVAEILEKSEFIETLKT